MSYASVIKGEAALQSYWQLNETVGSGTVADSGPGAVTGTPNGGITLGASGLIRSDVTTSCTCNGTTGGINMGDVYGFTGTASFSVELWCRTPASFDSAQHFIVSKERNDGIGVRQGWNVGLSNTNHFESQRWHGVNVNVDTDDTSTLSVSTIYYVVVTYDGTNSRIYVNAGAPIVGASDANSISAAVPTTANFGIGAMDYNNFFFFAGDVGHVAIYNAVLTAAQISTHYALGLLVGQAHMGVGQQAEVGTCV